MQTDLKSHRLMLAGAMLMLALSGCGNQHPEYQSSKGDTGQVSELAQTKVNPVSPEYVAEAFALGSKFTDLQRDLITKDLIGSVIEWDIQVYDVSLSEGVYKVNSMPLPIKSKEAVNLLSTVAFVHPVKEADHDTLRRVNTGDAIRIRGQVLDIVFRTAIVISPAILTEGNNALQKFPDDTTENNHSKGFL